MTEGQISAAGKNARLTSLAGIVLAFLPTLIAVVYLSAGLSFSKANSLLEAQASYALEQRTTLIESEVKAIKSGLERAVAVPGTRLEGRFTDLPSREYSELQISFHTSTMTTFRSP
jgi:hypothetical protein